MTDREYFFSVPADDEEDWFVFFYKAESYDVPIYIRMPEHHLFWSADRDYGRDLIDVVEPSDEFFEFAGRLMDEPIFRSYITDEDVSMRELEKGFSERIKNDDGLEPYEQQLMSTMIRSLTDGFPIPPEMYDLLREVDEDG